MADDGYRFLQVPFDDKGEVVLDKSISVREFATYFLMRVMKMFKWENLPEEIPEDCLNKMLLTEGFVWFTKWNGRALNGKEIDQYYVFRGKLADVIDAYYRPTSLIVSNPGANCYKQFGLDKQKGGTYYGEDGVILRNDTLYHGLMPMINRYAYLLAENVLTMHSADVFLRIIALISAQDDKTVVSANEFIRGIEQGKMSAVAEGKFFEGVKLQSPPSNNGSYLTQFIEYQQYFLGSFFNEIGLNANFNMKRESIAKSESSLNEDSMLPICQNMLKCRQEDVRVINEMFGLNIKVSFDSAWLQNALEIVMELETLKNQSGMTGNQASQLAGGQAGFGHAGGQASQLVGGEEDDKATEEDQAEKDVVGRESGAGGEGETAGGSNNLQEGVQGGTGSGEDTSQAQGASEEDDKLDEKLDELIEQAAGLAETLDESEESEESEEEEDESSREKLQRVDD